MKKLVMPLLAIVVVLFCVSCKPSKEDAVKYNDKIIDEQVAITQKIEELNSSFKTWTNADSMDICWVNALDQTEKSIKKVSEMREFHGNCQLRDGAIALFKVYKAVINVEFREMVAIYKMPNEFYGKEQEQKWTKLSDTAFNKLNNAIAEMGKIQQNFAKEFGFEISSSQK